MRLRGPILTVLFFGLAALAGFWLARSAMPTQAAKSAPAASQDAASANQAVDQAPAFRSSHDKLVFQTDTEAETAGALPGQRVLTFANQAALERFLARNPNLRILGRIDRLFALRVGFLRLSDLTSALDGSESTALIFPVQMPNPAPGGIQPGAVGLGPDLPAWLGISGDRSSWGSGVTVAILDTGVTSHPALAGTKITSQFLVDPPANPSDWNGHGTAVASLVAGADPLTPGVAPGASLLSIRVADDNGSSDTFTLAQGILNAADAGASIINISMGSYGDSSVLSDAVKYAISKGALIIASSGNEALVQLAYPASYPGVISVGAVDANGDHMLFSNEGGTLAVSAPGYLVNAAWSNGESVAFSGTSASAPIISGAIAALMSSGGGTSMTAAQAWSIILANLDDAGAPGTDSVYGGGLIDLGRALRSNTPGIVDAAVASHYIVPATNSTSSPTLEITVQNRGTSPLVNAMVETTTPSGTSQFNISTLAVGKITTFSIPLYPSSGSSVSISSTVKLSSGQTDAFPANNSRTDVYTPPAAP